jgi:hypothetical protein
MNKELADVLIGILIIDVVIVVCGVVHYLKPILWSM